MIECVVLAKAGSVVCGAAWGVWWETAGRGSLVAQLWRFQDRDSMKNGGVDGHDSWTDSMMMTSSAAAEERWRLRWIHQWRDGDRGG